jgi:hypothetical protein
MILPIRGREMRVWVNSLGVSVQWWPIPNLKHYTLTLYWSAPGMPLRFWRLRRYGAWEKR